tara:strand:+ start:55 stop:846 length:792 start_codon:yes stop_codon:yes gene_type:complete
MSNRERGITSRYQGPSGTTGRTDKSPNTSGGDGGNRFTEFTKENLNPQKDIFTQSYKAPGIFGLGGGYRSLNVPGDTSQGFKQGIGSKILGGILGLINPALGLGYRAITSAPNVFNKFKSSSTLEQFRDNLRGYGRTMPVESNNPMFGGIDSLRTDLNINPKFEDFLEFRQLTPDDVTFEEYLENIQNAPTGILQSSVLPNNNLLAFSPGSLKDKLIKNAYSGYTELGIGEDKLKNLMREDIKQNQEKGTPLSLPKQAYSLVG